MPDLVSAVSRVRSMRRDQGLPASIESPAQIARLAALVLPPGTRVRRPAKRKAA